MIPAVVIRSPTVARTLHVVAHVRTSTHARLTRTYTCNTRVYMSMHATRTRTLLSASIMSCFYVTGRIKAESDSVYYDRRRHSPVTAV